jgi:hypothetical protein
MKGCAIQIDENTEDQWISSFLLPPRPDQIVQPDFSVKDAPDVDKALQKSQIKTLQLMETRRD